MKSGKTPQRDAGKKKEKTSKSKPLPKTALKSKPKAESKSPTGKSKPALKSRPKSSAAKPKAKPKPTVKSKPESKSSAAKPKHSPAKSVVRKNKPSVKKEPLAKDKPVSPPVKKTSRVVRPKSFEQLHAITEHGFAPEVELPENYGRDRLVLMTQEPDILFSYWEITPSQLRIKESAKRDGEGYREALKLNWPAQSLFEPNFAVIPVTFAARRWYLKVPFPGLLYQVEIGWLGRNGEFISILESNPSESPESWEATLQRLGKGSEILSYSSRFSRPSGYSGSLQKQKAFPVPSDWVPGSPSSR